MLVSYDEALSLLGFPPDLKGDNLTLEDVRKAFRQQALKWHPDKQSVGGGTGSKQAGASRTSDAAKPDSKTQTFLGTTPTSASEGQRQFQDQTQHHDPKADAEERFKRLAAAYHVALQTVAAAAAAPASGAEATEGGLGPGGEGVDEDRLADALSAELLVEASRLRLSDFDMMFLHQYASGSTALSDAWPESAQSVEDIWRRMRRKVERRRKRLGLAAGGGGGGDNESTSGSKWTLLYEFVGSFLGTDAAAGAVKVDDQAGAPRPQDGSEPSTALDGICATAAGSICDCPGAEKGARREVPGGVRGRLPPGFYVRWLKRLVAARLVFYLVFKS